MVIKIIQIFAGVFGGLAAVMSVTFFVRLRWPAPVLWFLKLYVSALSPILAFIGALSALVGFATGSFFISALGIYVGLSFIIHIFRVTRPPDFSNGFEKAFGLHWKENLKTKHNKYFLQSRRVFKLSVVPDPRFEQNISFAAIPGSDRQLLCDIWQPPSTITPSGLAFIYLHGSAWYMLDKDLGTRPFFSHLAAQGHVIMDVAYRLAPETDVMGMVNDAKRAISWMKENSSAYGVNPDRVVLGGGSAGAHLALLAAYTDGNPEFTPKELEGKDTSVNAVISLYGPSDLEAMYYHLNQHLTTRETPGRPKKAVPTKMPEWMVKKMGKEFYRLGFDKGFVNAGAIAPLMGGHPDECPERYTLFSVATHVHPGCPPTLLIHGEHDLMAPVKSTRHLNTRLTGAKIKTVMHILPQTDHAFDLQLPKISPSAHNAIYDVECFLALINSNKKMNKHKTTDTILHELLPV